MSKHKEISVAVAAIYKRNGKLTPSMVVNAAKPKSAPLHKYFEWDDKKAGHEYRLMQARKIIRVVQVVVDGHKERFIHVPSVKRQEGQYMPVSVVVEQPDDFTMAMEKAVSRLHSARRAVKALESAARDKEDETLVKLSLAIKSISMAQSVVRTLH